MNQGEGYSSVLAKPAWEGVSTISLSKLGKLVEGDELAAKQSRQILRFAETKKDYSVKLTIKIKVIER